VRVFHHAYMRVGAGCIASVFRMYRYFVTLHTQSRAIPPAKSRVRTRIMRSRHVRVTTSVVVLARYGYGFLPNDI